MFITIENTHLTGFLLLYMSILFGKNKKCPEAVSSEFGTQNT